MEIKNKVAIVTGSSSGIGAAVAIQLAGQGAKVVVNYASSAEGAAETARQIEALGGSVLVVQGDVGVQADCDRLVATAVEHFGALDILINNAGTTTFVPHTELDQLTEDIWYKTLKTNLIGAFLMSRAAVAPMKAAGGGAIVMTSSIAGLTANGSSIAYCASKAGMNSLTRTLAKSLGAHKIRVNAVCPGLIDGDWAYNTWGGGSDEQWDQLKTMFEGQTPLGHVVTPNDVADAMMSLLTGSDFVTGQLVTIDSGFTL